MFDETRISDLYRLDRARNDRTKSNDLRLMAHKNLKLIVEQMKDKTLTKLRGLLVEAHKSMDELAVYKAEVAIKKHVGEPHSNWIPKKETKKEKDARRLDLLNSSNTK